MTTPTDPNPAREADGRADREAIRNLIAMCIDGSDQAPGVEIEDLITDALIDPANRDAVLRALGAEYVWMVGHERFLTEKAARAYHRASPSNPDGSPVRIRRQLVTEWEDVTL